MGGYFLYDGDQVIEERDASNNLSARYVYGSGIDEPITLEKGEDKYFYFSDGLGNITDIAANSTTVVESYTYDVYGQPSQTSTIGNPYMFTGRRYDETGLYYYRARMYSPSIGRFLQRDPIGQLIDTNLYRYVNNNPVNWIDPFGLDKDKPLLEDIANWFMPSACADEPTINETPQTTIPNNPTPKDPTRQRQRISFWERIGAFFRGALDAAVPGIPPISTTETAGEAVKAVPVIIRRSQDLYEEHGGITGQWGPENPYYDLIGVKPRDKRP